MGIVLCEGHDDPAMEVQSALNVRPHSFSGGFVQVDLGVITDTDTDNIENYFYDLPTAMKRRNCHAVPVGDGDGLRIASLPILHHQTGLNASPAMFIYSMVPASSQCVHYCAKIMLGDDVVLMIPSSSKRESMGWVVCLPDSPRWSPPPVYEGCERDPYAEMHAPCDCTSRWGGRHSGRDGADWGA